MEGSVEGSVDGAVDGSAEGSVAGSEEASVDVVMVEAVGLVLWELGRRSSGAPTQAEAATQSDNIKATAIIRLYKPFTSGGIHFTKTTWNLQHDS